MAGYLRLDDDGCFLLFLTIYSVLSAIDPILFYFLLLVQLFGSLHLYSYSTSRACVRQSTFLTRRYRFRHETHIYAERCYKFVIEGARMDGRVGRKRGVGEEKSTGSHGIT